MLGRHVSKSLLLTALLSSLAASPAFAQWMWKDEQGHVVASDMPPPSGTPQSRIIKEPRPRSAAPAALQDREAAKADAPKSLADRDLDAKQHDKEAAEAARKADDDATKAKAMHENCAAVRGNLAALQAGGRAARFNEKGERIYLDDAQRGSEIQKSQGQIAQYCK